MVIAPAMAATPLIVFLGPLILGPFFSVYYVLAGVALTWQWCSIATPRWKEWLANKGVPESEVADLAHRAGLVWPAGDAVGLFAFHTTVVAVSAVLLAPRLGRLLAWLLTG